jgi:hypothetical protein
MGPERNVGRLAIVTLCSVWALPAPAQVLYGGVGHIPTGDQLDWTVAGRLPDTPPSAQHVYNVAKMDGANDFERIQAAMALARGDDGMSLIHFPAGTYLLTSPIALGPDDHDLVFRGDGSDRTLINCQVGADNNCFDLRGTASGPFLALPCEVVTCPLVKGTKDITIPFLSESFAAGDWIHLEEPDFPSHDDWASIGQITRLVSVDEDHGVLKDEASKTYHTLFGLGIRKVVPVSTVGIEGLKIHRVDTAKASLPDRGNNLFLMYAVNCWIRGVESVETSRHHVMVDRSSHLEISGSFFDEARDHGSGGYGYGVILQNSTTNTLVENNLFTRLRHSLLLQAGANANVLTYNYSREAYHSNLLGWHHDIALHGNYPYGNLIEQNVVHSLWADNSHGDNGPFNALVRNLLINDQFEFGGYIWLHDAPSTALLGNHMWSQAGCPLVGGGNTSVSVDLVGRVCLSSPCPYEPADGLSHCAFYFSSLAWNQIGLADVSYHHSARPGFLEAGPISYDWPSVGPGDPFTQVAVPSGWIPPAARWSSGGRKTYLGSPTTVPPPQITGFTQVPEVLRPGNTGVVYVHTSGYVSEYEWEVVSKPPNFVVGPGNGASVIVTYLGGETLERGPLSSRSDRAFNYDLLLRSTVKGPDGAASRVYPVRWSPSPPDPDPCDPACP